MTATERDERVSCRAAATADEDPPLDDPPLELVDPPPEELLELELLDDEHRLSRPEPAAVDAVAAANRDERVGCRAAASSRRSTTRHPKLLLELVDPPPECCWSWNCWTTSCRRSRQPTAVDAVAAANRDERIGRRATAGGAARRRSAAPSSMSARGAMTRTRDEPPAGPPPVDVVEMI